MTAAIAFQERHPARRTILELVASAVALVAIVVLAVALALASKPASTPTTRVGVPAKVAPIARPADPQLNCYPTAVVHPC